MGLQRMLRRALAGAFEGWLFAAREMQSQRLGYEALFDILRRKLASKALGKWRSKLQERLRLRNCAMKIISGTLSRCFLKWLDETRAQKLYVDKVGQCLARMQQRSVHAAFRRWREFMDEMAEQKSKASATLYRIMHRISGMVFDRWKEAVHDRKALEEKLEPVILRLKNRAVAAARAILSRFM